MQVILLMSQMPIGKYIYCTILLTTLMTPSPQSSQMPIGKYIYCTERALLDMSVSDVTNAYRQVHLLYLYKLEKEELSFVTNAYRQVHLLYPGEQRPPERPPRSQMPIGKYIYCTWKNFPIKSFLESQMPIGKYIYCT